ncbi:stage II sporulation protein M [Thermococcus waiotapuensis]|uniref:Stage II sporulation protein M n=1 Tax=Thermococcus waiotapuensis TaxID=90909 RepID=A0AAE4T4D4_9EURY|nr:stage II sporulation protein M [Thermococcus waiotapuensis]MDV3104783.1 stage II sporulation protein M [Thermococcus waiotapuensis]
MRKLPFTSSRARDRAKEYFVLLTLGFTIAVVFGAITALTASQRSLGIFESIGRSIAGKIDTQDRFHTFLSIYFNNLGVATSAYALGVLFGIVPWLIVMVNGFILGLVVALVISQGLMSPVQALLAIVPHGVFEIPAILLSATAGILLYRGTLKKEGLDLVYSSLRLYALSAGLLLLAAFIEAFVTPRVAGL